MGYFRRGNRGNRSTYHAGRRGKILRGGGGRPRPTRWLTPLSPPMNPRRPPWSYEQNDSLGSKPMSLRDIRIGPSFSPHFLPRQFSPTRRKRLSVFVLLSILSLMMVYIDLQVAYRKQECIMSWNNVTSFPHNKNNSEGGQSSMIEPDEWQEVLFFPLDAAYSTDPDSSGGRNDSSSLHMKNMEETQEGKRTINPPTQQRFTFRNEEIVLAPLAAVIHLIFGTLCLLVRVRRKYFVLMFLSLCVLYLILTRLPPSPEGNLLSLPLSLLGVLMGLRAIICAGIGRQIFVAVTDFSVSAERRVHVVALWLLTETLGFSTSGLLLSDSSNVSFYLITLRGLCVPFFFIIALAIVILPPNRWQRERAHIRFKDMQKPLFREDENEVSDDEASQPPLTFTPRQFSRTSSASPLKAVPSAHKLTQMAAYLRLMSPDEALNLTASHLFGTPRGGEECGEPNLLRGVWGSSTDRTTSSECTRIPPTSHHEDGSSSVQFCIDSLGSWQEYPSWQEDEPSERLGQEETDDRLMISVGGDDNVYTYCSLSEYGTLPLVSELTRYSPNTHPQETDENSDDSSATLSFFDLESTAGVSTSAICTSGRLYHNLRATSMGTLFRQSTWKRTWTKCIWLMILQLCVSTVRWSLRCLVPSTVPTLQEGQRQHSTVRFCMAFLTCEMVGVLGALSVTWGRCRRRWLLATLHSLVATICSFSLQKYPPSLQTGLYIMMMSVLCLCGISFSTGFLQIHVVFTAAQEVRRCSRDKAEEQPPLSFSLLALFFVGMDFLCGCAHCLVFCVLTATPASTDSSLRFLAVMCSISAAFIIPSVFVFNKFHSTRRSIAVGGF